MKKSMMTKALFFCCGANLILSSCGVWKTKDKGKKFQQMDASITEQWKSACKPANILELSHTLKEYRFNALGDFDKREYFYKDDQCQEKIFTQQVTGTYQVVGKSEQDEAIKNINFTVERALITPESDTAVDMLNAASICGINDWQKGKEVDISGKECLGATINKGDVIYNIYRINTDEDPKILYFGEQFYFGQSLSRDERPESLKEDLPFTEKK